jgi:hypothetical protein
MLNPATGELFLGLLNLGVTYNSHSANAGVRMSVDGALVLTSSQEHGRRE